MKGLYYITKNRCCFPAVKSLPPEKIATPPLWMKSGTCNKSQNYLLGYLPIDKPARLPPRTANEAAAPGSERSQRQADNRDLHDDKTDWPYFHDVWCPLRDRT